MSVNPGPNDPALDAQFTALSEQLSKQSQLLNAEVRKNFELSA